jgi:3-oxoacyl-[acyl-carrier-protein] synthase II
MAVVTPLGVDLDGVWEAVLEGRSGVGPIERFDTSRFKVHFGGEVKNFDPSEFIDPRECKRLDRFAQFALVAACRAAKDAGLDFAAEEPSRCGVVLGSGVGGLGEMEEARAQVDKDPNRLSPHTIPRMILNSAPGHIAIRFGLEGPVSAVATACASAAHAIGDARRAILQDEADVMFAGGSEAALTPLGLGGFAALRALSLRNDAPQAASRPFDKDRDGFVLSEGAGLLILEEYEHARRRGARIYAELLGFGSTSDALHITAPDPEGRGAARAMRRALADAKLDVQAVKYVNAHGTSTDLGDKAETLAVKAVFGPSAESTPVSSTKSQLGHLLGASGGVELILTTLAIYNGEIPPTINLDEPDDECDLDYVPNEARESPIAYAMSNSFGFGGHNASLVVGALDGVPRRGRKAA